MNNKRKDAKRPLKCSKTWAAHCCYFLLLLFLFLFFIFFCHCVINMDFKESSQSSIWYAVWSITSFECHCKNRNTSWKRTHDRNFRFVREVCREKQQFYVEKIQPQHTQVRMRGCNEKKTASLCFAYGENCTGRLYKYIIFWTQRYVDGWGLQILYVFILH